MGYPRQLGEDRQVFQKTIFTDANATLGLNDRVVVGAGAHTLTLPPVSEAYGRMFTISNESGEVASITVADAGDSTNWADLTITDTNSVVLYSDGRIWHVLSETA